LKNIRSYVNQLFEFPKGSLLLSGDIGSGKSTILLACEFALFGLLRGETTGGALLRHGESKGEVELKLDIDGKDIIINRRLLRKVSSIEQDSGFYSINGVKVEATASELRSKVFELIGYPQSMLQKSKLLYRYTVYTPQEDMKRVILDTPEERLVMLRKLFDIDKYEVIKANAGIYSRLLREKTKLLEGMLFDVEIKRAELEKIKKESAELSGKKFSSQNELNAIALKIKKAKDTADIFAVEMERLRSAFALLSSKEEQRLRLLSQAKRLDEQVKKAKPSEIKEQVDDSILPRITVKQAELSAEEKKLRDARQSAIELKSLQAQAASRKAKVLALDNCPTCMQKVSEEHKCSIIEKEDAGINNAKTKLEEKEELVSASEKIISSINIEIDKLRSLQQEQAVLKARHEAKKKADIIFQSLEKEKAEVMEEIEKFPNIAEELAKSKKETIEKENAMADSRNELNELLKKEKILIVEQSGIAARIEEFQKRVQNLEAELEKKKQTKEKLDRLKGIHSWLSESLVPLIGIMEKEVFARLHGEFSERLQKWLGILLGDVGIAIRLDEAFSPVVEQDGYELPISHLSGGEQTACALSYRLALTSVVNDAVSGIKTKDIIVLDEPTDGFSKEQLVKMNLVLKDVPCEQMVIVSHEPELEGFVDTVVKISKTGGESKVSK